MSKIKEPALSEDVLDLKDVGQKLEALSHNQRMYVAGAISALEALNKVSSPATKDSA